MAEENDARYQFRLPRDLREAALEKARREDILLSQVLRRFLRAWVAEDPPEEPKERG